MGTPRDGPIGLECVINFPKKEFHNPSAFLTCCQTNEKNNKTYE